MQEPILEITLAVVKDPISDMAGHHNYIHIFYGLQV